MTRGPLIDDRLLISHLLAGPIAGDGVATTSLWYFRACRAAVLGAGGALSGPCRRLDTERQNAAIRQLLLLGDDVSLPDQRAVVPEMARLAERHTRLNLMNLEALAAAVLGGAEVLLSPPAARGVLPDVLTAERVSWRVVEPA